MKKKIIFTLFVVFITAATFLCSHVKAQHFHGGSGGGGNPSNSNKYVPCAPDVGSYNYNKQAVSIAAVKITVEWRDKDSSGGTLIEGSHPIYVANKSGLIDGAYIEPDWFDSNGANSGAIQRGMLGPTNDKTKREKELDVWIKRMGISKGLKDSRLTKLKGKSCEKKADNSTNCVGQSGVRIMIQNMVFINGDYYCSSYPYGYTNYKNFTKQMKNYWASFHYLNMPSDTNIYHVDSCKSSSAAVLDVNINEVTDANSSCGLNNIDITPYLNNYDYSIDAACENCDDNNANGSYFIQDTTDWDAILDSEESDIEHAKNYFKKTVGNCKVFCREEYRITFPNANNKINAEAGRFFTLNKLGGAMYADGIPNMRQVKVTKVRECRAVGDNQKGCLTSFASAAKGITGNSAGKTGTIKVKYDEKKYFKDSKYNTTVELEENKNRTISKEEYINNAVGKSNVMLKSTVTKYFELPDEIYRWVNIRDGQSSLKKPNKDIIEHFLDMETPNFPISHGNYSKSSKVQTGADLTFNYSLPNPLEDPYTLISKAFNAKNNYFASDKPIDNLYKQAIKGELDEKGKQQIGQSACAKLFGFGTNKYNKCINDRTVNKAGNCYTQVTVDGKYKCNIGVCPEEGCPSQCQIIGDTYYGKDGKQVSQNEYAKQCGCMIIGGKYYGQKGTEVTKEEYLVECPQICRIENGKYYGKKGQIVSKEQYEAECPNKCAENCEAGYCCPDLDMVCPTKDENGMWSCPGRGKKIIYRPIDLANPFPGQTNYNRATGNNWCAYNVKTGKMNCKSTNGVATTHIQQNRSKDDENLYRQTTPLYEVDLDPTIIKNIRKYNKGKDYDDFTLNCNTKLKEAKSEHSSDTVCYSTFLREGKTGLNITGECARLGNLATCAESRG